MNSSQSSFIYTPTPSDYLDALRVARVRNNGKIGVVPSRKVDRNRDDLEINFIGVIAEKAVASLLGTHIDRAERMGDGGVDLAVGGKTIQVKFNTYANGDLYFNSLTDFAADIGVLVVPHREKLKVVGWIEREEFRERATVRDFGYGERVCVRQSQLRPMPGLRWLLTNTKTEAS